MPGAQPRRDPSQRQASAVGRRAPVLAGSLGAAKVSRKSDLSPPQVGASAALSVPVGWATYFHLSQVVAGSANLNLDGLHDTEGDTSWLLDNGSGLTNWDLDEPGLYEIHVYSLATTDRPAGNCVEVRAIGGFRFPGSGPVASIGFNGTGGITTNPRIACQTIVKTVSAMENTVTLDFRYQGSATTLTNYVTFVKVL